MAGIAGIAWSYRCGRIINRNFNRNAHVGVVGAYAADEMEVWLNLFANSLQSKVDQQEGKSGSGYAQRTLVDRPYRVKPN